MHREPRLTTIAGRPSTYSCCAHDLARDWKRWSRSERIAASLLAVISVLMPIVLYRL